jgi:hypothetical protein
VLATPVLGVDGTIYVGSYKPSTFGTDPAYFYAIYPDGTLKWSNPVPADIRYAAAISKDGSIYVGTNEGVLLAYDKNGNQVKIWDEAGTSYTLYRDVITLYVDHTGPELNFKDVTIGTPTTNPCPLFTLIGPQLTNATLDLKFKAVQRQGFLDNYKLTLTKCNSPNFPVTDQAGHPLNPQYAGGSPCSGLYGTVFGIDPEADTDDYVALSLSTGGAAWLADGESVSSFTLNLQAHVRRTDGHSVHYPVHYGPRQYNFVVERGE